jgi:hypothetical protein
LIRAASIQFPVQGITGFQGEAVKLRIPNKETVSLTAQQKKFLVLDNSNSVLTNSHIFLFGQLSNGSEKDFQIFWKRISVWDEDRFLLLTEFGSRPSSFHKL